MRLPKTIDDPVVRSRSHVGAAHEVDGRNIAARGPHLLGTSGLGDGQAFNEVGFPKFWHVVVVAVDDPPERHAELVLVSHKLDAVFDIWHFLPERPNSGESAGRAFHEGGEIGTEQIETSICRAG